MAATPKVAHMPDVLTEQGRLNSFHNWPHSAAVEPTSLARAGFFYLGQADRVRCAFCGGTLKNWQHGDDPWQEHQTHFSHCPFVQGLDVGNVAKTAARQAPVRVQSGSSQGHRQTSEITGVGRLNPHHPDYQTMDSRRTSFQDWPQTITQQPEDLADAGFFYVGQSDHVRCFCCGGTLRNWEPNDEPWEEHAKWFPRCPYLLQQKGRGYVTLIQGRCGTAGRVQVTSSPASSPCRKGVGQSNTNRLSEAMRSETVKEALAMGFTSEQVKNAVLRILPSTGNNLDLQKLISTLLGDENHHLVQAAGEGIPGSHAVQQGTQITGWAGSGPSNDDRILCKICMDHQVEVTFLPCGHLVCCAECSRQVNQCPMCRRTIKASIRTYLS